jgi:2-pyrone-4,6-dicarboxylate lactonase
MNRRECLSGLVGLAASGAAMAALSGEGHAQTEQPRKEPPMIAGPDPNTKTPAFKLPRGTVDTHTHIFGPAAKYPYAENRSYTPPEAPLAAFRDLHAKISCDRAVIVNASVHGTDHRVMTDAIAESGGLYKGIANVPDAITVKEMEALKAAGVCGCRFTFLKRLGGIKDMGVFQRIARQAADIGWHLDVYLETGTIAEFAPILSALPTPYVIDHMGTIQVSRGLDDADFKALLALQARDEKCWIKITGFERASAAGKPFHDAVPFAKALVAGAPDRVLWGTDWPHPNVKVMPNDGETVDLVPLYAPDEPTQRKLLVENPTRLFGFASV